MMILVYFQGKLENLLLLPPYFFIAFFSIVLFAFDSIVLHVPSYNYQYKFSYLGSLHGIILSWN